MNKKTLLSALVLVAAGALPAVSMAGTSANIGWVSDYIFRGVFQEDSSASAGFDYESDNGFYVGTWGADVGDGLETDLYFGYGGESGDLSWGVGYTGYFYTDDFDDTYQEINLNIGYGIFALDVALGDYDGFGNSQDYTYTSITLSPEKAPYFKLASFGSDFDGTYLEIGYDFDFMGLDLNVAMLYSDDVNKGKSILLSQDSPASKYALTFGITKSFDVGD